MIKEQAEKRLEGIEIQMVTMNKQMKKMHQQMEKMNQQMEKMNQQRRNLAKQHEQAENLIDFVNKKIVDLRKDRK